MKPKLVIVTGHSGAGKSVAIKAFEDLNYYCIDNLPVDLIESTLRYLLQSQFIRQNIALGLDVRSSRFVEKFIALQQQVSKIVDTQILFLRASSSVLAQRFSTTRRRHPMQDADGELTAAIGRESAALVPIEKLADLAVDTSSMSPHQLARYIETNCSDQRFKRSLHVTISSFGFKHGILNPIDSLIDVRFLQNPHYVPELKVLTGLDPRVRDYVFADPRATQFSNKFLDLQQLLLPAYYEEGKHYYRIGIGCSGGQHRSVAIAEHFAMLLSQKAIRNIDVSVTHRDLKIANT